jgi:preprotein translocase subunit SecE
MILAIIAVAVFVWSMLAIAYILDKLLNWKTSRKA